MDTKTLENESWRILGRAAFARENDMPYGDLGYRHIGYYGGFGEVERVIAHLLERGFMEYQVDRHGLHTWAITSDGLKEYERLRNPPDPRTTLDAEIAACEARLAGLKAARAALEPKQRPDTETAVKRGLAARFHEGD